MIKIEIKTTDKFKSNVTTKEVLEDLKKRGNSLYQKAKKAFVKGAGKVSEVVMSEAKKMAVAKINHEIGLLEKGRKKIELQLARKKNELAKLLVK